MQGENAFLAPTVLLPYIKDSQGGLQNFGKIEGIHVDLDRRRQNLVEVSSGPDVKIVRNENFTDAVFSGEFRVELVREAFDYLASMGGNEFFQGNEGIEISSHDEGVQVDEHTYAPARHGRRVKLHELVHPYSQFFPMFFPRCKGDVDDPVIEGEVSEVDWAVHFLRYVKKNLVEVPLFVFAAAFRLDIGKIIGGFHTAGSYRRTEDGQLFRSEGFDQRQKIRLSQEYYAEVEQDLLSKSHVFGYPQFFFTFSNNPRWHITLSTALSQDEYDVWHKKDESRLLQVIEGFDEPDNLSEDYFVHLQDSDERFSGNNPRDLCMYHLTCRRIPMTRLLESIDVDKLLSRHG